MNLCIYIIIYSYSYESTPEMVNCIFRETILIFLLLPGPYNMAYEKIRYTNPFARLPVFPFARLPVCPFGCLAVWPFGRSSQALYGGGKLERWNGGRWKGGKVAGEMVET